MTFVKLIVVGLPFLTAFAMCGRLLALKDIGWIRGQLWDVGVGQGVGPDSPVHRKLLDAMTWQRVRLVMWTTFAVGLFLAWLLGVGWAIAYGW